MFGRSCCIVVLLVSIAVCIADELDKGSEGPRPMKLPARLPAPAKYTIQGKDKSGNDDRRDARGRAD